MKRFFAGLSARAVISVCVVFALLIIGFRFPSTSGTTLEGVLILIGFFVVLPSLYTVFVLGNDPSDLFVKPFRVRFSWFAFGGSVLTGSIISVVFFFTPFVAAHSDFAQVYLTTFRGFAFYELFYVLPIVMLCVYFGIMFVGSLHLSLVSTYLLAAIAIAAILVIMLRLPGLYALLFLTVMFIHHKARSYNFHSLAFSCFLSMIVLDTLIAKSFQA